MPFFARNLRMLKESSTRDTLEFEAFQPREATESEEFTDAPETSEVELSVPGRICLFGEHSDWSGSIMRKSNPDIAAGLTIVCGIGYGLRARVHRLAERVLRVRSVAGPEVHEIELPLDDEEALARIAREGSFFSYAAGVAYKISTEFNVGGLFVDNFETTLPLRKGLSSSAAFCVLIARSFNTMYALNMTPRGEMEVAFQGERLTPSQCGKMDQCVAYGCVPVVMRYDGDILSAKPAKLGGVFYIVLVDLKSSKSTVEILKGLQSAYPFPRTEEDRNLHRLLGDVNLKLASKALKCLERGDAPALGALMNAAQEDFDRWASPLCPSQLGEEGSPVLHRVLRYGPIQDLILGGKGVGSQGDGTAQLLCKDQASMQAVCDVLEADLGVECMTVVLK